MPKEYLELRPPQQWIAEWDLESLAKEAIIHGAAVAKDAQHTFRSWNVIVSAVRALRTLESAIYKKYGTPETIQIEMVRVSHRQIIWQAQRPNSEMTARYYKIFNRPGIDEICFSKFGLTVTQIYQCGTAVMSHYLTSPALRLPFQSDIAALDTATVQNFIDFVSLPIAQLRSQMLVDQRQDEKFLYTYNLLRQYPLIKMRFQSVELLVCPVMTLLYWKFTSGLYYELYDVPAFGNEFGDSFQRVCWSVPPESW